MRYIAFLYAFVAACGKGALANNIPDDAIVDRTLQDTVQDDEDTRVYLCENSDELFSDKVQVVKVGSNNVSIFGLIIDRFNGSFDNGSRIGRWMNGFFNLFRPFQTETPKFTISTEFLIPALSKYSVKAKSLATLLRNESATYATASGTPDVVAALFDLSAENMESMASAIDPIVDEMSQSDTMDLSTFTCLIRQLLTHLQDDALPNIVSMAEFIYTKSGNEDMESRFDDYVATRLDPSDFAKKVSRLDIDPNQCPDQGISNSLSKSTVISPTSIQTRLGGLEQSFVLRQAPPAQTVGLLVLFPISILVSILSLVIYLFIIIFTDIFESPNIPEDDDSDCYFDDPVVGCNGSGYGGVLILDPEGLLLGLIILPLLILASLFPGIEQFVSVVLSPLFERVDRPTVSLPNINPIFSRNGATDDVMQRVSGFLESIVEDTIDSLKFFGRRDETENTDTSMDEAIQTLYCQNDAIMTALPF